MLWLRTGNVKEGRMKKFQQWVKQNEGAMQKYAPMGWRYRGTYSNVLGFGAPWYSVTFMWECTKYGDFDTLRNYDDPNWVRLMEETLDFIDVASLEGRLLREMGDTHIYEPRKPKR